MNKEKIQVILLSAAPRYLDYNSIQTKALQDTASKVEKFISINFQNTKFKVEKVENIYFINIPRVKSLLYLFKIKKEVKKILNPNIKTIITAGNPFDLGILGIILKYILKCPLNVQVHTNIYSRYFIKAKKRHIFYYLISFFTLPFTNSIRTVGYEVYFRIKKKYRKKVVENIPEMLDVEILPYIKNNIDKKNIRFLCVARFDEQKNLPNLLNAFIKFNTKYPNTELKLVGGGPLKEKLSNILINNKAENYILLNDWTNNIGKEYAECDFCILTSYAEGFGMVIIESMKYGKPFLATPFGGAAYLIKDGENGFMAKNFSKNSIYDLLEKAYLNIDKFDEEKIKETVKDFTKNNMDKDLIRLWKNTN